MPGLRILLWVIAMSQFVLGALTLFAPLQFYGWMGLTVPAADNAYMIGMLGARFVAYGIGMAMLAQSDSPSRFWITNMVLIQAIDFAVGLYYLTAGVVAVGVVAFPMFNAALFAILLMLYLIRGRQASVS